jgi:hypothetical protein
MRLVGTAKVVQVTPDARLHPDPRPQKRETGGMRLRFGKLKMRSTAKAQTAAKARIDRVTEGWMPWFLRHCWCWLLDWAAVTAG